MRTLVIAAAAAVVAALLLGATGAAVSAQTPTDPESVFRGAIDAFNRGDAAASAAFFSEDVTVTGLCQPAGVCHGRAELQAALEEEIAHQAQDEILSLTVNGDVVTAQISETFPDFGELGIERILINITATVQDGLIVSMTDELDLSDAQTAKFAQAIEQEQEPLGVPATGTGYAAAAESAWPVPAMSLLVAGALMTSAGLAIGYRRRV